MEDNFLWKSWEWSRFATWLAVEKACLLVGFVKSKSHCLTIICVTKGSIILYKLSSCTPAGLQPPQKTRSLSLTIWFVLYSVLFSEHQAKWFIFCHECDVAWCCASPVVNPVGVTGLLEMVFQDTPSDGIMFFPSKKGQPLEMARARIPQFSWPSCVKTFDGRRSTWRPFLAAVVGGADLQLGSGLMFADVCRFKALLVAD